jgi:hypothetical protein
MIFLAKYIYVFELNLCTLSFDVKIHILLIILDLYMFSLEK